MVERQQVSLKVPHMSCAHCKKVITEALEQLSGIISLTVDLENKHVTVEYDGGKAQASDLKQAIEAAGYEVEI